LAQEVLVFSLLRNGLVIIPFERCLFSVSQPAQLGSGALLA
jgi:hypothetical protein